jgi:hypothetical protein
LAEHCTGTARQSLHNALRRRVFLSVTFPDLKELARPIIDTFIIAMLLSNAVYYQFHNGSALWVSEAAF